MSQGRSIVGSAVHACADVAQAPPFPAVVPTARHRTTNNFDALRLIAALLVLYGHQTLDRTGTVGLRLVMFFAIGGFLVTGSWQSDPHLGRFVTRRFLRVWPAYAALIATCAIATWIFPSPDLPEISRIGSWLYLTNLWAPGFDWGYFALRDPMINRSIWMMPFEFDMYLAFALVALLGRRTRIAAAVAALALAMPATQTTGAEGTIFECWSPYFGGFFAFGVLLRELPALRRTVVVGGCVVCGVALLFAGARTAGLLFVIPPAAVWIGLRSWPVVRSAARFGDLSYGVFLWSWPIQQLTRLWLAESVPVTLQLVVVLAQVLPIAWLSWRFVEAPALRRKPRVGAAPALDRSRSTGWRLAPVLAAIGNAPARVVERLVGLIPTPFR